MNGTYTEKDKNQLTPSHCTSHLYLGLAGGLLTPCFVTKSSMHFFSNKCTTCTAHCILFDLIILVMCGKEKRSWSFSSCYFSNHTAQSKRIFPCILLNLKHKKNVSNNNPKDCTSWTILDKTHYYCSHWLRGAAWIRWQETLPSKGILRGGIPMPVTCNPNKNVSLIFCDLLLVNGYCH